MSAPGLQLETAQHIPLLSSSSRPSPITGLTTFPNPFDDEPEPGLLPTLLSKVKSTFAAATTPTIASSSSTTKVADKGSAAPQFDGPVLNVVPTEAQQLAEAVKGKLHARRQSGSGVHGSIGALPPELASARGAASVPFPGSSKSSIKPALSNHASSSSIPTKPPSVASAPMAQVPSRRLVPPGEKRWRPTGAAPAQVTVTPVTSSTVTISAPKNTEDGFAVPAIPARGPHRAHFGLQAVTTSSRAPLIHHAHNNSLGGFRARRSSIATIPDSPSSISLSAMIAANAELSQNTTYVPGFPLQQDDTRSVRSMGYVKKTNSVSRIIRRMRGEGLSKHYWMADEHCKECYDCKSVFTAWRRKHHCRICGQIFCSRCASNIIGARRFGQEGAVRVCNLCLKIMEEYRDDDEDDKRSINSVTTSGGYRLPSLGDRTFLETTMSPEMPYARSPFAASQLFTSHPNDSLAAIDETMPTRWNAAIPAELDRPFTPNESGSQGSDDDDDDHIYTLRPGTAAPFRRPLEDDAKSDNGLEPGFRQHSQPTSPNEPASGDLAKPTDERQAKLFARTETYSTDVGDSLSPLTRVESNQPLIGLRTRLSSRTSQGGITALLDTEKKEGLWRARSHSFAQRPELLAGDSLAYLELMLQQAIARAELPNAGEWHRVLSSLLLRVSTNLHPNVRAGDSIDVRTYVKIKKVPGGKISDSEYVDGIVITKNVAHKAMPRRLVNPRIMVVTFPLDYHRVENQFMSLDPILAQEKDYLRLLTKRIIDVRPHIVLAQRSASRIALDYLLEANIAVARSVKISSIHQVARCTQADVVASMDRLALEPRLGRCAEFQIQSFEHDLIPGRRKTLMRFEGCHRDYGCTIILRGSDLATLRRVKIVTDFMALVAYHLKNEIILYSDEHNIYPPRPPLSQSYQELLEALSASTPPLDRTTSDASQSSSSEPDSPKTPKAQVTDDRVTERQEALDQTRNIAQSLKPYLTTILSPSTAIRYPPPAPLAKMADLDRILTVLRHQKDDEEAAQILQEERKVPETSQLITGDSETATTAVASSAVSESGDTTAAEMPSSAVMTALPVSSMLSKEATRDPYRVLRKPDEIARESTLAQIAHQHSEQLKLWEWYRRRHAVTLRPEDYQGIVYLYSLGCESNEKPCVEPTLQHLNFYQPDDLTVGQYLEGLTADAGKRCPSKTCERLLLFHFKLLVHSERRLQIAMDQFPCPSPGHEDRIITWSYCRICATPSPTTIMRDETWKMSWGAYLEHCFYPPECQAGFSCPHDAYRDQIRYFAHRNLAVRIHNEQIDIFEPVRPSITLQIKAETKVVLKNQEYESALHKNAAFFDSVLARLRSIDTDIVQLEKIPLLKAALDNMLSRAVADREEIVNLLNRTYKLTHMTDVLAMNTVLRTLQDKVVQWDVDFTDIEKAFMPSEKDLRRMTANHLKRLFANQDVFGTLDRNATPLTVTEADEKEIKVDDAEKSHEIVPPNTAVLESGADSMASAPGDESGVATPIAGVLSPAKNPFSLSPTTGGYDSDSTISAMPRDSPQRSSNLMPDRMESSGLDSDSHAFVSRLPRRTHPAPSIADLVKRFQESAARLPFEPVEEDLERPRSAASTRKSSQRRRHRDGSDSDQNLQARPRLRRGRTEQPPPRRDNSRLGPVSDGDRSYAANASRIPSSAGRPTFSQTASEMNVRPPSRSKSSLQPSRSARTSGRNSPDPAALPAIPVPSRLAAADEIEAKPRIAGKGRALRSSHLEVATASGRSSPGPQSLVKAAAKRQMANTSRVTSIARHFDRLSREAERERQKRNALVRGKRARPVGVTKAKVEVFNNVRDAFRDEFDTDSSEADNEEDDQGSDDSADSGRERKIRRRSGSLSKGPLVKALEQPPTVFDDPPTRPMAVTSNSSSALLTPMPEDMTASASASSIATSSIMSDTRSEMSFTDRLQIELPSFETSAPLPSVPVTPQLSVDTADEAGPSRSRLSQLSESEISSGGERSSILKSLTGLWAFRAGDYTPLEYPLSAAEHIFADSRVIIRENEPTSVIAFTLSSKTYRDKMRNVLFQQKAAHKQEAFMPEDTFHGERASTWDIVSLDEAVETDDPLRREGGTHLKYDFESGGSTIFCRIFFAERFAALRSACQCEDSFVESLARCVQFDAAGGKSGSAFLKTKDDRFIAKEISRLEMDALTKFAPAYFEYTRKAFQGQRPSVLAKIYGFFKIGYRNAITGRSMRMNVLVMENLFYERRFSKIYDLKGSTRNRLIQPTGRVNEVLLDENLMEIVYKHPLYLREHAKRILRTALFNDTLFLSNLNVMDYSLVVGVDSDKHELVVGIVDYVRTFTWDKKLESWVKDSAFLGGAGKGEPTIVTPKQYKTRFRTAMERFYFPSVPDRWTKLVAEEQPMEEEGTVKDL